MENAVDVFHRLRGQVQAVDKPLNRVGGELIQADSAQTGDQMIPDNAPVAGQGAGLHAGQIGRLPDAQPFGKGQFLRSGVGAPIYGGGGLLQLPGASWRL